MTRRDWVGWGGGGDVTGVRDDEHTDVIADTSPERSEGACGSAFGTRSRRSGLVARQSGCGEHVPLPSSPLRAGELCLRHLCAAVPPRYPICFFSVRLSCLVVIVMLVQGLRPRTPRPDQSSIAPMW